MGTGNTKKAPAIRPVTVRVSQLKNDIQTAVLKSELPPFMIEMILGEYLAGIRMVAQKEYAQDQAEWENACKEGEGNGKHSGNPDKDSIQ